MAGLVDEYFQGYNSLSFFLGHNHLGGLQHQHLKPMVFGPAVDSMKAGVNALFVYNIFNPLPFLTRPVPKAPPQFRPMRYIGLLG